MAEAKSKTAAQAEPGKQAAPADPMDRRATRTLPLAQVGEPNAIYASLNGKGYLIPRGKPVTLPEAVWEVVERMLAAERVQEDELRKNQ